MKLYGFPPSPNTWQVRALASYLGVPLEFEFVDLTKGGAQTPAFVAINPTARTPALVDGDFKLWETMAIMQYVAGKKPGTAWPNDARACRHRALAELESGALESRRLVSGIV
jgi:glutathione S-transferase